jgi:hypothetical protein
VDHHQFHLSTDPAKEARTPASGADRRQVQKAGPVFPQHGPQPVIAEIQSGQGLQLVGVSVGDVREIGTEHDTVPQPGKTVQITLGMGAKPFVKSVPTIVVSRKTPA